MKTKIHNGECFSGHGYRQVLFDNDLNIRPVVFGIYSGSPDHQCSVQVAPENRDVLLKLQYGGIFPDGMVMAHTYKGSAESDINPDRLATLLTEAHGKHPWLKDWLQPQGTVKSFIPSDIVPDSEYLSVKNKLSRIHNFFDSHQLPHIEDGELMTSPKSGINLAPVELDFNLSEYVPESVHILNNTQNIDRWEEWFSVGRYGKAKVMEIVPSLISEINTKEDVGSFHHDGKDLHSRGMPMAWTKLIRVIHGAYIRDGHSYGHKVDVWCH